MAFIRESLSRCWPARAPNAAASLVLVLELRAYVDSTTSSAAPASRRPSASVRSHGCASADDLAGEDQLVVADEVEQRLAGVAAHLDAALLKALRDPADCVLLADLPGEDVAHLRARFGQRSVLLDLRADEAEHGPGGRVAKVRHDRL